jgi:putative pyrroloquinoline-quinone binding quinoprotein/putative Ig domain-containing protein
VLTRQKYATVRPRLTINWLPQDLQGNSLEWLLNLSNLSGQSGPVKTGGEVQAAFNVPQGGNVLSQPAVWINPADASTWVFVTTGSGISGLKLSIDASGNPTLSAQWQSSIGGTSPLVANNVLYYAGGSSVRALDPAAGALLWSSGVQGTIHWQSPIVANGSVYLADNAGNLTAFDLPAVGPGFTSPGSSTFQIGVPGSFTVRATGAPVPTLAGSGALPDGITFTAASGVLAATPTAAGTFALQFAATNGIAPDAVQSFTLNVAPAPPPPASMTYTDPACSSFVMSGTPPAQVLTCVGEGAGGVPVCAPTANPSSPAVGQQTTISANCSNQPSSYVWTGSTCSGTGAATCTVVKSRRTSVTFTVQGTNAAGTGAPATITVSWH